GARPRGGRADQPNREGLAVGDRGKVVKEDERSLPRSARVIERSAGSAEGAEASHVPRAGTFADALDRLVVRVALGGDGDEAAVRIDVGGTEDDDHSSDGRDRKAPRTDGPRSEEHTSELQS